MASSEFHLIHSLVTKFSSILLQHYLSISRDGTSLHYDFGVRQWPGLVIVARIALPLFVEPRGVVLSEGSLNSILSCPMFGASLVNGSLGRGKDRPFDEHFDYTQTCKSRCVSCQLRLFIVVTPGLLAEVQADWEHLNEMLSRIDAVSKDEGCFSSMMMEAHEMSFFFPRVLTIIV